MQVVGTTGRRFFRKMGDSEFDSIRIRLFCTHFGFTIERVHHDLLRQRHVIKTLPSCDLWRISEMRPTLQIRCEV